MEEDGGGEGVGWDEGMLGDNFSTLQQLLTFSLQIKSYKEANKVASGDLTTIHSIQKSATDAAMPVLTRATDVALPVMNRVYTDAAIPALSKGLDALETLGTIGAKGVSSLLDGAGAGAGAAGAVVLNSSSVSSISVHPQNTPVLVDPHSEDPLSDATSRSPLNAAISSSPKTTPLPKLTLFLENNAGNANFQVMLMIFINRFIMVNVQIM